MTSVLLIIFLILLVSPTARTLYEAYDDRRALRTKWPPDRQPVLRQSAEKLIKIKIDREWLRLLKHAIAASCIGVAWTPMANWPDAIINIRTVGLFAIMLLLSLTSIMDNRVRSGITREIQEVRRLKAE